MPKSLTIGLLTCAALAAAGAIFAPAPTPLHAATPEKGPAMLAHNVFFSLNDNSETAKQKLVAACRKYLSGHPGEVFFAAGTLAADCDRSVNDRDFDVALHVAFTGKAAHDQYQQAERHLKFIAENQDNWKKVRVFDSYVEGGKE
jgi:hypothetical protein